MTQDDEKPGASLVLIDGQPVGGVSRWSPGPIDAVRLRTLGTPVDLVPTEPVSFDLTIERTEVWPEAADHDERDADESISKLLSDPANYAPPLTLGEVFEFMGMTLPEGADPKQEVVLTRGESKMVYEDGTEVKQAEMTYVKRIAVGTGYSDKK